MGPRSLVVHHAVGGGLSGAFDRNPRLQLIVGHVGETPSSMLPRLDVALTRLQRPVSAYLRENLDHTFSGFNWMPNFIELLLQVGVDRMVEARSFLDRSRSARPIASASHMDTRSACAASERSRPAPAQEGTHR